MIFMAEDIIVNDREGVFRRMREEFDLPPKEPKEEGLKLPIVSATALVDIFHKDRMKSSYQGLVRVFFEEIRRRPNGFVEGIKAVKISIIPDDDQILTRKVLIEGWA